MFFIVGSIIVVVCVLGGYMAMGGKLAVLNQPFEVVIICGAALGAFIIANPKDVIVKVLAGFKDLLKSRSYNKAAYLELLVMLFATFKMARAKGVLALEAHVENPHDSEFFKKFPAFYGNHHAVVFFCDYLRLITMGTNSPHQLEDLMDQEIETHHEESHQVAGAVTTVADGMPALGIVAAVLGVIKTMGSISEPPEVLGKLIGGALVGTFLGVWISYGFVGPMGQSLAAIYDHDTRYLRTIKVGLLAFMHGHAPQVAVEFARKNIFHDMRPDFYEVEEAIANAPTE